MKEITISDVRAAIDAMNDEELSKEIAGLSDEALLDMSFRDDFDMDSLEVIEVAMELERKKQISIPDESVVNFNENGGTVKAMIEEINRVIGE